MQIAFIVDEFPSTSQTFVLNQITGLLERGQQVDVYTRHVPADARRHPDVARYGLLERTLELNCPNGRWARVVRGASLCARKLRANPAAVWRSLNVFRYGRTAASLTLLCEAAPFFRRYDIVHCQFGHNGRFGARLKELGLQKRLVVTFHGWDIRRGVAQGGAIYDEVWRQADCLIAISDYNREHLLRFGGDPKKIVYHPVGIDWKRFDGEAESRRARGGALRILSVARLVKEKGLEFGLRAVHQLRRQRPDIELRYDIIGEGDLRPSLERLIEGLGLGACVRLLGANTQEEVIGALRAADILLAPSLAEALPVSLMEAHAAGLPVVATRVGSVHQIVRDGVSGFLVPPGDAPALSEALLELVDQPERRARMGCEGRRHVRQHYDIDRLNDRLVDLYQGLLAA